MQLNTDLPTRVEGGVVANLLMPDAYEPWFDDFSLKYFIFLKGSLLMNSAETLGKKLEYIKGLRALLIGRIIVPEKGILNMIRYYLM